jgi:hypothetical protein
MRKYGLSVSFLAILAIAVTWACGSPAYTLQSVSLSPATADAQGNPVQFTATGYFNQQPSQVKLTATGWGACNPNQPYQPTTAVSVSAAGVAQCAAGAVGTYRVWAVAQRAGSCGGNNGETPYNPCPDAGVWGCQVVGTAQLTCP